jgi:hypothetical protein
MKKLIVAILLLSSVGFATTDIKLLTESIKPLLAALNAAAKMNYDEPAYLPGYGLSFVDSVCDSSKTRWQDIYVQIKGMTAALGQTVKGLDSNEWLSLTTNFICDRESGNPTITVREKGSDLGKPDKWEVWIDGVLQK